MTRFAMWFAYLAGMFVLFSAGIQFEMGNMTNVAVNLMLAAMNFILAEVNRNALS